MIPSKSSSNSSSDRRQENINRRGCLRTNKQRTPSQEFDLKKVIFDEVNIREYPQILGDNPAVTIGAPITIGWTFQEQYSMDVNFYEYMRQPLRQKSSKLIMSPKQRVESLLAAGYSLDDIGDATMDANHIKRQRLDSLHATGWNGPINFLNGAFETTGSALKAMDILGVGDQTKKLVKKSSKVIFGGVTAAAMGIARPGLKKKSHGPPAC